MAEPSCVRADQIILGTMRLHETSRSLDEWLEFFVAVHRLGIRTLHSSSEYESFELLRDILDALSKAAPDLSFGHVVKLAEPGFADAEFDGQRMIDHVDDYRSSLGVDHIECVQWMWRAGLADDVARVQSFAVAEPEMQSVFRALKTTSAVGEFLCFPYSTHFAERAVQSPMIDGLTVYRNRNEREYDGAIDACAEAGKKVTIIRPFDAGACFTAHGADARSLLSDALEKPAITAAILSSSNLAHLGALVTEARA